MGGNAPYALASICVAAAGAAFLLFNFPPARIFMGDAGSIPLGFLAAAVGALGWHDGLWPLWFPVVVFAPFVVDASVTLVRRAVRGERVDLVQREIGDLARIARKAPLTGYQRIRLETDVAALRSDVEALR